MPPSDKPKSRVPLIVALLVVGVIVVVLVFLLLNRGDDGSSPASDTDSPAAESAETGEPDPVDDAGDAEPAASGASAATRSIEVDLPAGSATWIGPTSVAVGEPVTIVVEFRDADGNPRVGETVYSSIGKPVTSSDALHAEAVTDEQGRAEFPMGSVDTAGPIEAWIALEGSEAVKVTEFDVDA